MIDQSVAHVSCACGGADFDMYMVIAIARLSQYMCTCSDHDRDFAGHCTAHAAHAQR